MTPVDALKLALSREDASIKMYQKLAAEHVAIKDLLLSLAEQEYTHKHLIEKKIAQLTH